MSSTVQVLLSEECPANVPECAVPGASLFLRLQKSGRRFLASDVVRVNRQGGYTGFDAFVFLQYFFSNPTDRSVRSFSQRVAPFSEELASLAGRETLLSSSSLSRLLGSVTKEEIDEFRTWMLWDFPGIFDVLRRSDTQHFDRRSNPWLVLDFDPTITGVRQRALPCEDDLPEPRHRMTDLAKRGHMGRKRGQICVRTTTLFCQGAGLWLHADVGQGKGVNNRHFEAAGVRFWRGAAAIHPPID